MQHEEMNFFTEIRLVVFFIPQFVLLELWHTLNYLIRIFINAFPVSLRWLVATFFGIQRVQMLTQSGVVEGYSVPTAYQRPPWEWMHKTTTKTATVVKFEGIPYATYPSLFSNCVPISPVKGIVNEPRFRDLGYKFGTAQCDVPQFSLATIDSPLCITALQTGLSYILRGFVGHEKNGLQLNVWTPALPPQNEEANIERTGSLCPVPVFIHGGGFMFGSSHLSVTSGAVLAHRTGAVVVSINYRLGAYENMKLPCAASNGTACGTGEDNRGLRDQIQALRWIQRNIQLFGGDANRVTISGESAGSMSVGCLLATKELYEERLAQQAMMWSAPPFCLPSRAIAEENCENFLTFAGVRASEMHRLSVREVIAAQRELQHRRGRGEGVSTCFHMVAFAPYFDPSDPSALLPDHPFKIIDTCIPPSQRIPVVIGSLAAEYTCFGSPLVRLATGPLLTEIASLGLFDKWFARIYGSPSTTVSSMRAAYSHESYVSGRCGSAFVAMDTDFIFRLPNEHLASTIAVGEGAPPAFVFRFDRPGCTPPISSEWLFFFPLLFYVYAHTCLVAFVFFPEQTERKPLSIALLQFYSRYWLPSFFSFLLATVQWVENGRNLSKKELVTCFRHCPSGHPVQFMLLSSSTYESSKIHI